MSGNNAEFVRLNIYTAQDIHRSSRFKPDGEAGYFELVGRSSHRTLLGWDPSQPIVSSTPDAISAQAFWMPPRSAAVSLRPHTVLQLKRVLKNIQTSTRYRGPFSVENAIKAAIAARKRATIMPIFRLGLVEEAP